MMFIPKNPIVLQIGIGFSNIQLYETNNYQVHKLDMTPLFVQDSKLSL